MWEKQKCPGRVIRNIPMLSLKIESTCCYIRQTVPLRCGDQPFDKECNWFITIYKHKIKT